MQGMERVRRRIRTLVSVVTLLPSGAAALWAQGTIAGRVTDSGNSRPIADVQVRVEGTRAGSLTGADGRYTISDAPTGTVTVRAQRIGYSPMTRTVIVRARDTTTALFALAGVPTALDQIVVTATGETQRRRETPHVVASMRVDSMEKSAIGTFSQLLSSRVPGVTVQESGGTTGTGSRVRIRGSNSVSLGNDPLVIIDGVRVASASTGSVATTIGVGGQVPSRLNDINREDIETIEILKGPSAVSLYGTSGANGIIQITTKRGRAGRTVWTTFAEGGQLAQQHKWPANYAAPGRNLPSGTPTPNCTLYNRAQGLCAQDSLVSFNPLTVMSPFRTGNRLHYGLSAAGGTTGATYFLAGDAEQEQGVYDVSHLRRSNARANIVAHLRRDLSISISSNYLSSELRLPQNDNNLLGAISAGLLGSARDNPVSRGYASGQPPQTIFAGINTRQGVERFMGGVRTNWSPNSWLSAIGQLGLEVLNRHDNETVLPNVVTFASLPDGQRTSNRYQVREYAAGGNLQATWDVAPALRSTTAVGAQFDEERLNGTRAFGARLLAGSASLNGTTTRFAVTEENQEAVTVGGYVQQQVAWRDRMFANAGVRADDNSAFGSDFGFTYYPNVGVSWVLSEEPFFSILPKVAQVRVRASYGESGQRPGFRQAQQFFAPVAVNVRNVEVPGFTVGGVGNVDLAPETSREYELGADLNSLFGNLVNLEVTYYRKTTDQALIFVRTAPSLGVSATQPRNLGQVKNSGYEAMLSGTPFNTRMLLWELAVTASTNANKLVRLGTALADSSPIIFGLGGATQRHAQGYPTGSYFQRTYTYADANSDGLIAPSEVVLAAQPSFLGSSAPRRELTLNTSLTLNRVARVSANVDHRSGQKQYNATSQFRCASAFVNCRDAVDASATSLFAQARIAASRLGSNAGFIEDASFTKVRELSLSLLAPAALTRRIRVNGATLTFSGRNLATWTKYSGFDPEVNFTADDFTTADFLSQPPVKHYTVRLTLTF